MTSFSPGRRWRCLRESGVHRATTIVELIVLALAFAVLTVLLTGFLLGRWLVVPVDVQAANIDENKYQVFVDLLTVVLSISALAIAAFGFGAYRILSSAVQRRAEATVHAMLTVQELKVTRYNLADAVRMGYEKWFDWAFIRGSPKDPRGLEALHMAKDVLRKALDRAKGMTEAVSEALGELKSAGQLRRIELQLTEEQERIQESAQDVKNNLAYILAEYGDLASDEERRYALKLADDIYRALEDKNPLTTEDYTALETYCWVLNRFPRSPKDSDESRRLIEEVLKRHDVPSWTKDWYREKYEIPTPTT